MIETGWSGAFYAADGNREPVAALAATLLAFDAPARTWTAFEAFVARPTQ